MSKVFVVSRTRMRNGVCVGGINLDNKSFVRLHDERGGNLTTDAPYQIGEIWDIKLEYPWNPREHPHVEDMMAKSSVKEQHIDDISSYILSLGVPICQGDISAIFDGYLKYTQVGKPYINDDNVPSNSVCFWIPDNDLIPIDNFGKIVYRYKNRLIPYVGFQDNQRIAAGTLVRMSLANWWQPEEADVERRCYLQLSGWYGSSVDKWKIKESRHFSNEEIEAVDHAVVVASQYGNSVCFFMKAGGQTFIPLSNTSTKGVGENINLLAAKLVTLSREGNADIIRVEC